jgi:hypothetical protein
MRSKWIYVGAIFLLVTFIGSAKFARAADLDEQLILMPGHPYSSFIVFGETDHKLLTMKTNGTITLSILNQTAMGEFLINGSILPRFSVNVSGTYEINLTFPKMTEEYGIPSSLTPEGKPEVRFFIILENPGSNPVSCILRTNYVNKFLITFEEVARAGLIVALGFITVFFRIRAQQYAKEDENVRFRMLRGFSIGYFFGFVNYLMWEFDIWFRRIYYVNFIPEYEIQGPWFPFGFNLIQVLYLMLYAMTQTFVIYEIEKNVSQKSMPRIALHIVFGAIAMGIGIFLQVLFDLIFIYYVLVMLLGMLYFIRIYSSVAIHSSGIVRAKAILIILGVILPLLMGLTRGSMIPGERELSYILADLLSILSLGFFYFGAI